MEDTQRERNGLDEGRVGVETGVGRLRDPRVGYRVLVDRVVLDSVLNVGVDVGL